MNKDNNVRETQADRQSETETETEVVIPWESSQGLHLCTGLPLITHSAAHKDIQSLVNKENTQATKGRQATEGKHRSKDFNLTYR